MKIFENGKCTEPFGYFCCDFEKHPSYCFDFCDKVGDFRLTKPKEGVTYDNQRTN